jgi:dephospho-CoA kinase
MLAAQLDRQARRQRADDIIENDGSLARSREQVRRLHGSYLELARAPPPPAS